MTMPIISVEKTAITTGVATSAKELSRVMPKGVKVLDYGAGYLRNTHFLSRDYHVDVIDTPLQCAKVSHSNQVYTSACTLLQQAYDAVLCSYVLNVIPDAYERDSVVLSILACLKPEGTAWIEVRRPQSVHYHCKHLEPYNDGYLVGNGKVRTFQKHYAKEDLSDYLKAFDCHIVEVKTHTNSIVACVKKKVAGAGNGDTCNNSIAI